MADSRSMALLLAALSAFFIAPPASADEELDKLKSDYDAAQSAWYEELAKHTAEDGSYDSSKMPPRPSEKFVPLFRAYAEEHAGKPEAVEALIWLVNEGGSGNPMQPGESQATWAAEQLAKNHAADAALKEHIARLRYAYYDVGKKPMIALYERVIEVNKDKEIAGWAMFNLAYTLYEESPHPNPDAATNDKKRAEELFRQTTEDYTGTPAADRAAGYIYEIENLQIGMKAPEIVGVDVNEKEIKLSQFRGQVVVLDFWGFW